MFPACKSGCHRGRGKEFGILGHDMWNHGLKLLEQSYMCLGGMLFVARVLPWCFKDLSGSAYVLILSISHRVTESRYDVADGPTTNMNVYV
jgi:hypothetical protein